MDADNINDFIDKGWSIPETLLRSYLIEDVALTLLGVATGFWAILIGKIVGVVLDKYLFPKLKSLKRLGQFYVDVREGELFLEKKEEATQNEDENAIIDLIANL